MVVGLGNALTSWGLCAGHPHRFTNRLAIVKYLVLLPEGQTARASVLLVINHQQRDVVLLPLIHRLVRPTG